MRKKFKFFKFNYVKMLFQCILNLNIMINLLVIIFGSSGLLMNLDFLHWNEETIIAICLSPSSYSFNSLIKNTVSLSLFIRNLKIYESFKNLFLFNKILFNYVLNIKILFEVPIINSIKLILSFIKYEIVEYIKSQKFCISLTKIYIILYTKLLNLNTKFFYFFKNKKILYLNLIINKFF